MPRTDESRIAAKDDRTIRVWRYSGGWDVCISIASPNGVRRTAILTPEQAHELASALESVAEFAEGARIGYNGVYGRDS